MNKTLATIGSISTLLFAGFIFGYINFSLALVSISILGLFAIRKGFMV
jgi:hypothetical protein